MENIRCRTVRSIPSRRTTSTRTMHRASNDCSTLRFTNGHCPHSLSALMRWFLAGIGFYQWSQTLLGSQSGFVSKNAVRVASPACRFTVNLGSEILLKKECHCIVLELQSGFGQSLVIPNDQFVDASILPQLMSSGLETH